MDNPRDFNPYEAPQVVEVSPVSLQHRPLLQKVFFGVNLGFAVIIIVSACAAVFLERNKRGSENAFVGVAIVATVFIWYASLELRAFLTRNEGSERFLGLVNIICGLALFIVSLLSALIELNASTSASSFWFRMAFCAPAMILSAYAVGCGAYRVIGRRHRGQ